MIRLFKYPGGKTMLLDKLIRLMDYSKEVYVELFGGSAILLLNKPKHNIEIYNDINEDIFNLWWVFKNCYEEFVKGIKEVIIHESLFNYYLENIPEDRIERAIRTYYLIQLSYNSMGKAFAFKINEKPILERECFELLFGRIREVEFINRDFREVLNTLQDNNSVMIYADPPYWEVGKRFYKCYFSKKDHYDLAEMLNSQKGAVMVSYNMFDEIYELYPRDKWFYFFEEVLYASTAGQKSNEKKIEVILTNYNPCLDLFD